MSAFCHEPGCPGIAVTGKFCDRHKADNYLKRRNAARPEKDAWYSLAAWRVYVKPTKLRHDPICQDESGCNRPATDVHHIDDSWKTSGDWRLFIDQNNLKSLCHEHHSEITMRRNQERGLICKNQ